MNEPDRYIAPRTCAEVEIGRSRANEGSSTQPLENYSDVESYVLLAPPGSGKTEEFDRQASLCGGQVIPARKFIRSIIQPEWRGKTLFIDGLDEVRAGSADGRTPIDALCEKLQHLDYPRFRLSCREADWFGSNDHRYLESVASQGKVLVLRLDPLSEEDIKTVLHKNHFVEDPDAFIEKARQRGVAALLKNPLSLKLLAKAVLNNEWPDSRIHTFEMACETLADESNEEHRYATIRERANTEVLLDTAGQLCAVLLLAGAPGIRLGAGSQDDNLIELNELAGVDRSLQLDSLKTRLFEAPNSEFAIPLHRQVAEFMGARYLAKLVNDGLPVRRILALMSGYDGMIVTELRGLCAWLATQSQLAREELIARDPLGIILYGDVLGFSIEFKKKILQELEQVADKDPWFISTIKLDSRLGDLVSTEMKNAYLELLNDLARGSGRQSLVAFLVETLVHAQPLEGVAQKLMEIIRDDSRWPRIRQIAIKAFLHQRGDDELALADLKALMKEVYDGKISDPDDDLLGKLLKVTYPRALPGTEVLDYLRPPKSSQFLSNEVFWILTLPQTSNCEEKAKLLDELAVRYDPHEIEARQTTRRSNIQAKIPLILLDRFLSDCTVTVEPGRLFNWLGVAGRIGDWDQGMGFSHDERARIRSWLNERPRLWKTFLELGLKRCVEMRKHSETSDFQQLMWMEEDRRLFGAKRPYDFANWCLDQAIIADDPDVANWLMRRVADAIGDERISRISVDQRIESKDFLKGALEERLHESQEHKVWKEKLNRKEGKLNRKEKKEEKKDLFNWQIAVRDHLSVLKENRAPMQLLHSLATAYFGGYHGMTEYPPLERLNILLGNDGEFVEIAMSGLRGAVSRADLPTVNDVIKQGALNQIYRSSFPFLAGFNELSTSSPDVGFVPEENQNRLALAFYYNVNFWPNPWGYGFAELQPRWLHPLLQDQPELVSDILVKSVASRLRKGMDVSHRLYELAHSEDHESLARHASLPLLKRFPVRCTKQQLSGLRYLLIAAHRHCRSDAFIEQVKKKLTYPSMNVAQRVYWLAAGFVADPQSFLESLQSYVKGNKRRVAYLSSYIGGRFENLPNQSERMEVPALSSLISLLGAAYPPYSFDSDSDEEGGAVTQEMDTSFRIKDFIEQLSNDPTSSASDALKNLAADDSLIAWRTQLEYEICRQKGIRREAGFKHADVSTILGVLDNRQPANAADLAALTIDYLGEIAHEIRDSNTSGWHLYWNVDSYSRPERPRPENACRDALLSTLRPRLHPDPLNVDAQPEGSYADDKRADIRVSFGDFNIPVEIKKSCHRDLWSAIRTQLIAKYTRDPGADGHGIYLVFWFGNTKHCRPTPDAGPPPKSAGELKRRMEESLTDAERRKISVCVIDVEDRKGSEGT